VGQRWVRRVVVLIGFGSGLAMLLDLL